MTGILASPWLHLALLLAAAAWAVFFARLSVRAPTPSARRGAAFSAGVFFALAVMTAWLLGAGL